MFQGGPVGFFSIVLDAGTPFQPGCLGPSAGEAPSLLEGLPLSSPGLLVFGCWIFGALE